MQPSTLNLIQEHLSIELELKTPIVGGCTSLKQGENLSQFTS
jgi:hypothetical protein